MLDLREKLTLESFQLLLVLFFFKDFRNLSQRSVMFTTLNHFQKHNK